MAAFMTAKAVAAEINFILMIRRNLRELSVFDCQSSILVILKLTRGWCRVRSYQLILEEGLSALSVSRVLNDLLG